MELIRSALNDQSIQQAKPSSISESNLKNSLTGHIETSQNFAIEPNFYEMRIDRLNSAESLAAMCDSDFFNELDPTNSKNDYNSHKQLTNGTNNSTIQNYTSAKQGKYDRC